jgi:hypothetical protein
MLKKGLLFGLAAALAVAMACGGDNKTPVSPSSAVTTDAEAAADGSTLKVSAPTPFLPANGAAVDSLTPNLAVNNATGKFVTTSGLQYQFSVESSTGTVIYTSSALDSGTSQTGHKLAATLVTLAYETTYRWRCRAVSGSTFGPWSAYFTFTTPKAYVDPYELPGYQTATELFDPLTKGKTIGTAANMEFTVGKGARTTGNEANIQYSLMSTLTAGEFSFFVSNLNPLSAGDKTKLMSMAEGTGDITTNDYRFTIEKRGASYTTPGQVRWRMITGDSGDHTYINDGGPWQPALDKTKTYFVKCTWGNNVITLKIQEWDATAKKLGTVALNVSDDYTYTYKPTSHTAWIGAPVGRAGSQDASVANMTVWGVYIGTVGKRPDQTVIVGSPDSE